MMWWIIAAVLAVLWLVGFLVIHIAGTFIHVLLVLAVASFTYGLLVGRRGTTT